MDRRDELLLEAIQLLADGRKFSGHMTYSIRSVQYNTRVVNFIAWNQALYYELQAQKAAEDAESVQELSPEKVRDSGAS